MVRTVETCAREDNARNLIISISKMSIGISVGGNTAVRLSCELLPPRAYGDSGRPASVGPHWTGHIATRMKQVAEYHGMSL